MSKLTSTLSITTTSALLVGCSTGPAEEPDASPTPSKVSQSAVPADEEIEPDNLEGTIEASPEPSPEPRAETQIEAPQTPAPTVEPTPEASESPFVPPPHGEPNPQASTTQDLPGTISVVHPQPGYPGPSISVNAGLLRIGGSGYAPGERIEVLFGAPRTDQQLLDHSTAYAGPDGSYTFDIRIASELAGANYGLMTWAPERGGPAAEESKRYLSVTVLP